MITVNGFLEYFRSAYNEFKNVSDDDVKKLYNEVMCIFPEVYGIAKDCTKNIVAGYVVAHYIAINNTDGSQTIAGSGNMLSSASVGGISISTQSPPVHDMYEYFFGSTPYGLKFLAYIASIGGLNYVN